MELKKYIIINNRPLLFDSIFIHADVVNKEANITSAGFFIIKKDDESATVVCFGGSESLSVKSRPEIDCIIIANYLNLK